MSLNSTEFTERTSFRLCVSRADSFRTSVRVVGGEDWTPGSDQYESQIPPLVKFNILSNPEPNKGAVEDIGMKCM